MNRIRAMVLIAVGICCPAAGLLGADGKDNKAKESEAEPHSTSNENNGQRRPNSADAHPGERALERLERMTPEQRSKALANLPPRRRQEIEQKLDEFDRMPPEERLRVRNQLERMNRLPPQRQNQVRRSIRQFQDLPDDRKLLVRRELDRMAAMPDDARRAYMNTEEFRNRYTPNEQQMMQNLAEILPENRDNK
jgi:hypothetical protein